ncbi:hypothetical protein H4S08_002955 [Coemansia sp. RSA 1365]|nr:hypothetical protein H4S08_002955 [Coemansia sp. RSA 1365]
MPSGRSKKSSLIPSGKKIRWAGRAWPPGKQTCSKGVEEGATAAGILTVSELAGVGASADGGDSDVGIVGSLDLCPVWSSCRACRHSRVMLARLPSLRPGRSMREPAADKVSCKKAARKQS